MEFSADNWDDIMRTEPLEGFEEVDGHDAAYAIYTSGTTGNPKGVLHEYGNLNQAVDSICLNGEIPFNGWDRLATLAPMNFVAAVIVILAALNVFRGKNLIVSYATIKNPGALAKFFLSKRITITFLTPSCVRMLGNTTGPFLRMLFVGSEPANNLYNKNLDLINIYACSESGFAVGVFKIDKACETCPIGKPSIDTKITLLAEDGSEAAEGEMGELFAPLGIEQPQMNAMERAYKISRNEFFITVAALAVSVYNNKNDIKISRIYNGREDVQMMSSVELLFRDLPVEIRFRDTDTLRDVFADVHDQVQKGIKHSCYPYVDLHNQVAEGESAYLLYQQDIRDMVGLEGFDIEPIEVRQNQAASQTILDMEILDGADGLELMVDFAASRYDEASIEKFKDIYVKLAQALVTHNSQKDVTVGEIRKKNRDKKSFFQVVKGIFSRKK